MSTSVTVRQTTTHTSSEVAIIVLNFGHFKTLSGILQVLQTFLGYHGLGFILYLTGGLALLIQSTTGRPQKRELVIPAAVMGLINCGLYLTLFIVAYKKFR
ncbi:uncharacterized protein LOC143255055 isoform X3 [Tachypleus tridentatus]|uniref:uncharacterized protein LOC143255055 isoform X3 n=1 Tax=Tachypleus tridentatus TaxID=6853 RepID=UPI003FD2FB9B